MFTLQPASGAMAAARVQRRAEAASRATVGPSASRLAACRREAVNNFSRQRAPRAGGGAAAHVTARHSMDPQTRLSMKDAETKLKLIPGGAHSALSEEIAAYMGLPLTKVTLKRFADGENYVQIEESIRGCDVFIIQPTCPPVHDNLMELMQVADACLRASARTITAVVPYFGYARADRKSNTREAIAAKLVANLLTVSGIHRLICLDLHSGQLEGYFDLPVVHIHAAAKLSEYVAQKMPPQDIVVVSPDVGGVARARAFAKAIGDAPLAIIDKRRTGHNQAQVMNLIGDVSGRCCVLLDDMIDTAGTLVAGGELLHAKGARAVFACASHAVFSGPAVERLSSGVFEEVIVTNSIPQLPEKQFDALTVLSVADLLGEAIGRVYNDSATGSPRADGSDRIRPP